MRTSVFAPTRLAAVLPAVVFLTAGQAFGQTPRLIGGPGVPLAVNDPAVASITVAGKPRPLQSTTIVDLAPALTGRSDPQWVWLTGSPTARRWEESTRGAAVPGSFDVRWCEPLSKAEFDSIQLIGADGKVLGPGNEKNAPAVWLDATAPGWEALSRAAIAVIAAIPASQREAAFAALSTATQTPGDHWRAALLRRAIKPSTPGAPDFQPAALNTLALQLGDEWAGAIGRLSRADAALGQQVARRLLEVAFLPTGETTGTWVVVWADAEPHLLDTLLTAPAAGLATSAISYLAPQPQHIEWVRDDAGLHDAFSSSILSTIGIVSFAEQPVVASVNLSGQPGGGGGEPVVLKPLSGQSFTLPANGSGGGVGAGSAVVLRIGQSPVSIQVVATPVKASPPGVLVGPLYLDWTLDSFRRQQPVRRGGVAASLLPSQNTGGGTGGNASVANGWTVYLESRTQRDTELERERFRIWAGPSGAPIVNVELAPDGAVNARVGSVAAQVSRIPGGWCATVSLPPAAIDASGTLRLAVEHTAASGLRSCWPRPMLPWQTEPGRLAIDTAAWDRELRP